MSDRVHLNQVYEGFDNRPYRRNFFYKLRLGSLFADPDGTVRVQWQEEGSPTVSFPPAIKKSWTGLEDIVHDESASVIVKNFELAIRDRVDLEPGQVIRIGQ